MNCEVKRLEFSQETRAFGKLITILKLAFQITNHFSQFLLKLKWLRKCTVGAALETRCPAAAAAIDKRCTRREPLSTNGTRGWSCYRQRIPAAEATIDNRYPRRTQNFYTGSQADPVYNIWYPRRNQKTKFSLPGVHKKFNLLKFNTHTHKKIK